MNLEVPLKEPIADGLGVIPSFPTQHQQVVVWVKMKHYQDMEGLSGLALVSIYQARLHVRYLFLTVHTLIASRTFAGMCFLGLISLTNLPYLPFKHHPKRKLTF